VRAKPELPVVLVGEAGVLMRLAPEAVLVESIEANIEETGIRILSPHCFWDGSEPVEVAAIRFAASACLMQQAHALVTGPIHKARLARQGFNYSGHTDFLGALCQARPVMAFTAPALSAGSIPVCVALTTVHIPLKAVADAITKEQVFYTISQVYSALVEQLGIKAPRLVICGLNPHAGEEGLLGSEEQEKIGPACDQARSMGWNVVGPVSAETAFLETRQGAFDGIVAMYHDQALVPLKTLGFGQCVNWSLGLPILRTSVDHGTADALKGTGKARADSMIAALELAALLQPGTTAIKTVPVAPEIL
jgi:4-hydroxythreonine-4-phosphate dehydrogenase